MKERCLEKLKGKILLATNTWGHPVYILSLCALFSVRMTRLSRQKLPVRHTAVGDMEGFSDLTEL